MQLDSHVYAFPLTVEFPERTVTINPSGVETGSGLVLLDVGYEPTVDVLEEQLEEHGFGFSDVQHIVITHHDGDHAGALKEIKDRTDATVFAHPEEAPYITGDESPIKSPDDDRYPPASVDIEIVDGVSFNTKAGKMRVVSTPGHCPGHISLYFPDNKLLIAADAMTADDEGLQGFSEQYTIDAETAIESLEKLGELEIEKTLCFHGGFVEEGTDRIQEVYESYH
ncbi:MAG: MBL fold metallo-hydrolase [Halobacteria archaeon]|nr:MBL fold metallo-hydrolase [Halobacteria archaeon]